MVHAIKPLVRDAPRTHGDGTHEAARVGVVFVVDVAGQLEGAGVGLGAACMGTDVWLHRNKVGGTRLMVLVVDLLVTLSVTCGSSIERRGKENRVEFATSYTRRLASVKKKPTQTQPGG